MIFTRIVSSILVSTILVAQQPTLPPPQDTQALQILNQAQANMGVAREPGIGDIRVTGRLFLPNDRSQSIGTFDAKLRGKDFSMEITTSGKQSRYRVLNGKGSFSKDGKVKPLASYNTMGLSPDILPLFAWWTDSPIGTATIAAPTNAQVEGVAAYLIHIDLGDRDIRSNRGKIDVFVDQGSGLIVSVQTTAVLGIYKNYGTLVESRFAEYKNFGGLLLPTRITRYLNGRAGLSFQIDQVNVNTGLADVDFRN
jgi:hypothetical protein